jgi:hypothetical protein
MWWSCMVAEKYINEKTQIEISWKYDQLFYKLEKNSNIFTFYKFFAFL